MQQLRPTLLAFAHFFLIISSYYVIKPVRDALFVKSIGPDQLPWYYLIVAAIVLLVVALYNRLIRRRDSRRFVLLTQGLVALVLLGFWGAMRATSPAAPSLAAAFFIWASIYNVLVVTLFWSLTNDLFDVEQGRRHYGLIGGGGIVGGIVGGLATRYLPAQIGTTDCLLVAATLLLLAVGITRWRLAGAPRRAAPAAAAAGSWRDVQLLFSEPPVRLIAAVVFFLTLGKTIFNYHYYFIVDRSFSSTDATTSFFGTVYAATNLSSAVLQFVVTTWVLRRYGAKVGLLFSPVVLAAAMGTLLLAPRLLLAAAFNVAQQSTSYSINQSSKELLYTPCSETAKYRAKAVIDMFVFRFGDALAAIALLLLHRLAGLPPWTSLACGLLACLTWAALVLLARDPTAGAR